MPETHPCAGAGCDQDGTGPLPPTPCGSASLLGDDFEDNELGDPWVADWDGGSVTEAGGAVQISLAGTPDGDTVHAGLLSHRRTRLRNVRLSVEVLEVPAADQLGRFALAVEDPMGDIVELAVTTGRLQAGRRGDAPVVDLAYDALAHRYWALRETEGTLYWETSPDGENWTILAGDSAPVVNLASVRARLEGTAHSGAADGGTIRFDDVNGGVPTGQWCPVAELSDEFEDTVLAPQWVSEASGGCAVTVGGAAVLAGTGGEATCSLRSSALFDLTGGSLTVKVPAATGELSSTRMRLQIDPIYWIELATRAGKLVAAKSEGAPIAPEAPPLYDAEQHVFWRIREEQGLLEWATSPNGVDWTVLHTEHWRLTLGRFEVLLGTVAEEGAPASSATFDDVN
jgi:hypothetical protein